MATIEEKYEDEGYRDLMKEFAAAAACGDLGGLEKGLAGGSGGMGTGYWYWYWWYK